MFRTILPNAHSRSAFNPLRAVRRGFAIAARLYRKTAAWLLSAFLGHDPSFAGNAPSPSTNPWAKPGSVWKPREWREKKEGAGSEMAGPGGSRKQREQLFCPVCSAKGQDQPVMVPLELEFKPEVPVISDQKAPDFYGDRAGNPQFKYSCARCKFAEIYTAPAA